MNKRLWLGLLLSLAAFQILGAAIAFVRDDAAGSTAFADLGFPPSFYWIPLLACAAAGCWLLLAGKDDQRAVELGVFFVLLATPFANRWLLVLGQAVPAIWSWPVLVLRNLQADAFFP
ncbi:MAG TPA: hypothetical protein VEL74_02045, partial [Thermoanaerobaculia bacterium]|nr:hypothetical protein [Thermoanaerobaculia bacterium]